MALLTLEPDLPVTDLDDLLGIAAAMETEAVRLYAVLEAEMTRQGAVAVAAVFRKLIAMEQLHVGNIADFGREVLGHEVPPFPEGEASVWTSVALPAADEAASTMLTPYRALSIAVRTEERAFAFYTYLAAGSADPAVCRYAEELAAEELQHASQLRVERRKAYHREPGPGALPVPASVEALDALAARLQAEAARALDALPGPSEDKRQSLRETVRILERLHDGYGTIAVRAGSEAVMTRALALAEAVLADLALARQRLIASDR